MITRFIFCSIALLVLLATHSGAFAARLQFTATGQTHAAVGSLPGNSPLSITAIVDIGVADANIESLLPDTRLVNFDPLALESMSVTVGPDTITFNGVSYDNVGIYQQDNIGSQSLQGENVGFAASAGVAGLVWDGTLGGSTITEVSFALTVLNQTGHPFPMDTLYDHIEDLFSSVGPGSVPTLGRYPFSFGFGDPLSTGRFVGGENFSISGSSGPGVLTGFEISSVVFTHPVPEPTSFLILSMAAASSLMARRSHRAK
jgi:hypothetical protein